MSVLFQIVLSCSCIIALSSARTVAQFKGWFMNMGLDCSREYPITPGEALMLQKHKLPDSKNAKCLQACVYRKVEWLDDKGLFSVENAVKTIENEHLDDPLKIDNSKKLFDTCKKVNDEAVNDGDSGCERSALLSKCLIDNAPQMGFHLS